MAAVAPERRGLVATRRLQAGRRTWGVGVLGF